MALDFTNAGANNSRLSRTTNPPVTAAPLTMAGWFRRATAASVDIVGLWDTIFTGSNCFALYTWNSGSNVQVYAAALGGSGAVAVTAAAADNPGSGEWHHGCAVFTSATSRAAFFDGGNKATNATSITPSGIVATAIGQFQQTSAGALSDVAVWNVALSDAEVLALSKGMSPLFVRPSALVAYWPLESIAAAGLNRVKGSTDRSLSLTVGALADAIGPPVGERYYFRPVGWRGAYTWIPGLQPAPGTNAFWKAASDAATTDATGYTNEVGKLVAVSLIQVIPGAALIASAFATASPAIAAATLVQTQVLAAPALAVASPAFSALTVTQGHALLALNASAGTPILGAPGTGRVFNLDPVDAAAGAPVLGTPAIGQNHALTAAAAVAGSPLLGTVALKQKHVLAAPSFVDSSPAFTNPAASQGAPVPGLGFAVASPAIGTGTLKQKQVLAAGSLAVSVPVFGQPVLAKALFAVSLATSAPVIAAVPPGVTRSYVLLAGGLVVGAPTFLPSPNAEEIAPPVVWLRCKLERWSRDPHSKFYDDDNTQYGRPVKQAIFANLNDDIEVTMSSGTLGGRTSPERGPMETIVVGAPLWLADKKLRIDWSEVTAATAAIAAEIVARSAAVAAEIAARSAAITAEIAARSSADSAETAARVAADSALDARVVVLETRTYVDMGGVAIIAPVSGFTYNVAADAGAVIINPATNISSGTFKLPVAPAGRQKIDFIAMKRVNTLTFATDNGAHALANPPTTIVEGKCVTAVFGPVLSTWLFIS